MSWPLDSTRARMSSAASPGRPLITWICARPWSGLMPSSLARNIAAHTAAGLFRRSLGTNSVAARCEANLAVSSHSERDCSSVTRSDDANVGDSTTARLNGLPPGGCVDGSSGRGDLRAQRGALGLTHLRVAVLTEEVRAVEPDR